MATRTDIYDRMTDDTQMVLHKVYTTGDMANIGTITLFSLLATAGDCKDIKCSPAYDGATAANITPILWMSDPDDPATLDQVYPDLDAGHTHAGARTEFFVLPDLAKGCKMELRITSAGNDAGVDFDAVTTYLQ